MASASSRRRTVLVVDDSPFIRQVVRDIVDSSGDFEVVGEAGDGYAALMQVHALAPDLVTLDVQMPGLDGLATLGYVMSEAPRPVVMLSSLTDGGDTTMRALELGAVDFVRKPAWGDALDLATLRDRLLGALHTAAGAHYQSVPVLARVRAHARLSQPAGGRAPTHVVVIAASTGGPRALAEIIPSLVETSAAVVIAQHMPPGFTESLARRLDALASVPVREARDGEALEAGRVFVAPGGVHTTIESRGGALRLAVRPGLPVHGVAPAADPLFVTASDAFGGRVVAVVLTGMGQDGARGARVVREGGGFLVVQDERTSIVYGMPQQALALAGADVVAPLDDVANAIAIGLRARGCDVGPTAVAREGARESAREGARERAGEHAGTSRDATRPAQARVARDAGR